MASPVDVNELFSKCMTESVTEKLTARTVATIRRYFRSRVA